MASVMDVIAGISQVVAQTYDGALDENGEPIKVGLKREEEYEITDKRIIDGFKVKFHGENLVISYQSEVSMKEVHDKNFKSEIAARISNVASYLKKEYRKLKGESLSLGEVDEPSMVVQATSRHRSWVQAKGTYSLSAEGLESPDAAAEPEKLDNAVKKFIEMGRDQAPKLQNVTRKE